MALAHVREAPRPLPADVPPAVAALVLQMLAKDPGARPVNGAALSQAVGLLRTPGGGRPARPSGSLRVAGPPRSDAPRSDAPSPGRRPPPRATMVQPIAAEHGGPISAVPMSTAGARGTATAARPGARASAPGPARPRSFTNRLFATSPFATSPFNPQAAAPQTIRPRPSGPPPISQPQPPARSAPRRTGLSVLLAVLVLLLAALVLFAVDHVVGQMSAGVLQGLSGSAGISGPSGLR